jgi:flagellar biosynthesis protein FlhG
MRSISIASGKGGVGKTTLVSHLALALADFNQRVLILDGDLGMSNIDICFGVKTKRSLYDVVNGERLEDCITTVAKNVDILSGGNGISELTKINAFQRRDIFDQIQRLQFKYDFLLVDNSPGLHDYVLHLNATTDEIFLILTNDPSSFADAYSLVKVLHTKYKKNEFKVITNLLNKTDGMRLYARFCDVVEKFMSVRLNLLDSIPSDENLKKIQQRITMGQNFTVGLSASIFRSIANSLIIESHLNQNKSAAANHESGLVSLFRPASGHA